MRRAVLQVQAFPSIQGVLSQLDPFHTGLKKPNEPKFSTTIAKRCEVTLAHFFEFSEPVLRDL